jgi:hypothetical protein
VTTYLLATTVDGGMSTRISFMPATLHQPVNPSPSRVVEH